MPSVMEKLSLILDSYAPLKKVVLAIATAKGRCYVVGGTVRDLFLEKPIKDIDIEVHGLQLEKLQKILSGFGQVRLVGKQFGVLRIDGLDVDWSLPRKDSKGRHPEVMIDPNMTIEEAARRRDLTINAMAIDITSEPYVLHDPYDGSLDLQAGRLRAVDPKLFIEDPLRFWRVVQFIGRFEMLPDAKLTAICKEMDLLGVARERVEEELEKLFLKSRRPSLGFRWIKEIGRLPELLPELAACVGLEQRQPFHPEGDVFEHTMQSLDAGARILLCDEDIGICFAGSKEKIIILWGALCHDLGKVYCTDDDGRAHGHSEEGIKPAIKLLKRFTRDSRILGAVPKLVRYHLRPWALLEQNAKPSAYKRLARKLTPELTMRQLALLALCDIRGRNGKSMQPLGIGKDLFRAFLERAEGARVLEAPEPPVLLGRHLLGEVEAGPKMGELLKAAYEIQIEEELRDIDELKERVLNK